MIFQYISLSISIVFFSFMVGMMLNALIKKSKLYVKFSNFNFIKSDVVNQIIGIGVFKWMIKNTFIKFFNQKIKINKEMNVSDLKNIRDEMTKAEVEHLLGFGFVVLIILVLIFKQNFLFAGILFIANIIANLYPSLLQQWNKRILDKKLNSFRS